MAGDGQQADAADQPYAALDLGSNSFHLIVARYRRAANTAPASNGRLQVVDRHKEMVRLAEGLNASNELSPAVANRALRCLQRLGQRIRHLPPQNVRVVGTNTLRQARDSEDFLEAAKRALGHEVEIVGGREEARLIYLGVSHSLEPVASDETRLVVDIGGGSTELILGHQFQARLMESLHMGCVSMSNRHFANGRITAEGFVAAENAARQELEAVEQIYLGHGWNRAIGASGTIRAVHDAIGELTGQRGITSAGVAGLKERLLSAGHTDTIDLAAVDVERAPVFAGGLAIVSALFEALKIGTMTVSDSALREGLLHDLLGRVHAQDIREATVEDLISRYHIDVPHARRVAATATRLLAQASWQLDDMEIGGNGAGGSRGTLGKAATALADDANAERLLRWAALLHEIGLDIAHSQYHKHGGYLLDNLDMPGFSRSEQHGLSALVRTHRRKFPVAELRASPRLAALCVLLRLAVVLHRGRTDVPVPPFKVSLRGQRIQLSFPSRWLNEHPLTKLDLDQEAAYLSVVPLQLTVTAQ